MTHTLLLLSTSPFVGQSAAAAGSTVVTVLGVLCAAVGAGLIVAVVRLQAARRALKSISVEHQSTTEAHRALMDKERKLAKELDQRREEIKELKQSLGSQKKKGHSSQEETKGMRAEIKRLTEELEHARKERPAFEDRPTARETPADRKPIEAKPVPEAKPKPVEVKPESRPEPVKAAPTDTETRERLERLEADNRALAEKLRSEREEQDKAKEELQKLRRRAEGLRRIDIITKGKLELLDDKVRGLGRQYYEAVSELALLKGEVAPPKPRDLEPPPSAPTDNRGEAAGGGDSADA
jgi:DNA segregation ATPase FtsK/SpoIIIE-like protein